MRTVEVTDGVGDGTEGSVHGRLVLGVLQRYEGARVGLEGDERDVVIGAEVFEGELRCLFREFEG